MFIYICCILNAVLHILKLIMEHIGTSSYEIEFHCKRAGTESIRYNIVNIIVVDALAPRVARTSEPMILTM